MACREMRIRKWLQMHSSEGAAEARAVRTARRNVNPLTLDPLLWTNLVCRARSSMVFFYDRKNTQQRLIDLLHFQMSHAYSSFYTVLYCI
jgi:hypothetical protein